MRPPSKVKMYNLCRTTMLDKAVVIASEALDYIQSRFPADDKKYAELHLACKQMLVRLTWLQGELLEYEHQQRSKNADPCPCPRCSKFSAEDRELLNKCVREAVQEDIHELRPPSEVITKGNPAGKMTLVYDANADFDTTEPSDGTVECKFQKAETKLD
jgi:hypothetical protein